MSTRLTNWAGNVAFRAGQLHLPGSVAELAELVAASGKVRALGTGHSFNRIADTAGTLVSVAGLPPVAEVDPARAEVTVSAGMRYGELAPLLHARGYALPSLASLPQLSIAGACATGSHGSGDGIGGLATAVSAMEFVTATGEVVSMRRDSAGFRGSVVALGALGIVTQLTLDLVPAFDVSQHVYLDLPAASLLSHFDEIFAAAYSVSLFTAWQGSRHAQLWLKQRAGSGVPGPRWMGAVLADRPVHPLPGGSPEHATQQCGVPGPWHDRLPHFRAGFTPSSGAELQSEYLLPRQLAAGAFEAVASLASLLEPVLQISEIRTVAPDDLWLSPSYQRDCVAIHFTWINDAQAVAPVVAALELLLAPLGARPHWAKLFGTSPQATRALYARSADFQELLRGQDPAGKFRNSFLDRYFPAPH